MSDAVVRDSEAAIAEGSRSFAAAARFFDRRTRDDAVMLYAWCRYCDDLIDGQTLGHGQDASFRDGQRERLRQLRTETAAALSGRARPGTVFEALHRVVERHDIPTEHPDALLAGFEMDVTGRRYETIDDTLDYCYHVAGVVGVMMAMIMGVRDPRVLDRASDLGLAFQLTNIARDVIDDARAGRVYLPAELLKRHGITTIDPDDSAQRPALRRAVLELLDLADRYYASAASGLSALQLRSALAVAAARRVYNGIGGKLRANGVSAWDRRIATSRGEKLVLMALAIGDVGRSRILRSQSVPAGLFQRP